MKSFLLIIVLIYNILNYGFSQIPVTNYVIAIHGGAGAISKKNMTAELEDAYRQKLSEALDSGALVLKQGGTSLDAVEKAIVVMEDSPLFNAGKGSVLTADGKIEMDASIMDGKTLNAGAVAGVRNIKNPIKAASCVMNNTKHVLLTGNGAMEFAKSQGLEIVDTSYFYTKERIEQWEKAKSNKNGTVGCVALDTYGNLAAGTSTGGMSNKKYGRIGDSPIIGAGTYANNNTCAVSCTGHGEYFIRYVVAYDVSALMEYKGLSLVQAAEYVINEKLKHAGGSGGLIAVDKHGNIAMPFNTEGMYRACLRADGTKLVEIYK